MLRECQIPWKMPKSPCVSSGRGPAPRLWQEKKCTQRVCQGQPRPLPEVGSVTPCPGCRRWAEAGAALYGRRSALPPPRAALGAPGAAGGAGGRCPRAGAEGAAPLGSCGPARHPRPRSAPAAPLGTCGSAMATAALLGPGKCGGRAAPAAPSCPPPVPPWARLLLPRVSGGRGARAWLGGRGHLLRVHSHLSAGRGALGAASATHRAADTAFGLEWRKGRNQQSWYRKTWYRRI